jgi:hypothetical protein
VRPRFQARNQSTLHMPSAWPAAAIKQFRALRARAGFELCSITPTVTMVSIVEGRSVPRQGDTVR